MPNERPLYKQSDVPDALYPSDNAYGIPLLDINLQADCAELPVGIWASRAQGRKRFNTGTWLFYVDDEKFTALKKDPTPLLNSLCTTAGELNYSLGDDMPKALGLALTYWKRWIARFWQSKGVRILVDMNVSPRWQQMNLLGVPRGWSAYATRGYTAYLDHLEEQYRIAQAHSMVNNPLFVVYGGGKKVMDLCLDYGWVHIQEQRSEVSNG